MTRPLRLLLAASGGGHVRQLIDLQTVWSPFNPVIVTENTALGRSLAQNHDVRFVPHFAIGQARLGAPMAMIFGALCNLVISLRLVWSYRPDMVISTGAGAAFWTVFFARLFGADFVLIESFARFDAPSKFGRIAARLATQKVVQSAMLQQWWPDALIFDPFSRLDSLRPEKEPLLFATVGATLAFPRLSHAVIGACWTGDIVEHVILQAGDEASNLNAPKNVKIMDSIDFVEVQSILRKADIVVCHGGTGSLVTALREGCRVIAMPRTFSRREHYDDHQEEIVQAFLDRGLIDVAEDAESLILAIERVKARPAPSATVDPVALREYLRAEIENMARRKRLRAF